jgi:hypothetical protein
MLGLLITPLLMGGNKKIIKRSFLSTTGWWVSRGSGDPYPPPLTNTINKTMKRDQAYIVTRIITDEDGSTGYPGGDVDWRVRDLCDLAPGDEIASIPGDMDHCYSVIATLRAQDAASWHRDQIDESLEDVINEMHKERSDPAFYE